MCPNRWGGHSKSGSSHPSPELITHSAGATACVSADVVEVQIGCTLSLTQIPLPWERFVSSFGVCTFQPPKYFTWHLWEPTKNHKRLGFHQLDSVRFVHDESIPGNPWFLTSNNIMGIFFQTYVVLHFESSPVSSLKDRPDSDPIESDFFHFTPLKFNSSPLKIGHPKRKLIFQSHHFWGAFAVKFRGCIRIRSFLAAPYVSIWIPFISTLEVERSVKSAEDLDDFLTTWSEVQNKEKLQKTNIWWLMASTIFQIGCNTSSFTFVVSSS